MRIDEEIRNQAGRVFVRTVNVGSTVRKGGEQGGPLGLALAVGFLVAVVIMITLLAVILIPALIFAFIVWMVARLYTLIVHAIRGSDEERADQGREGVRVVMPSDERR